MQKLKEIKLEKEAAGYHRLSIVLTHGGSSISLREGDELPWIKARLTHLIDSLEHISEVYYNLGFKKD